MKNHYLAKHDDFVVANYDFNLETQRLFFACLYKMNSAYVKPIINELSHIYKLDFQEIKEISGIDYDFENSKEKIDRATKDLTSKIVKIKTKTGFVVTGIVKTFRIDELNKILTVEVDNEIMPYLVENFRKFTKFGFKHLSLCQSKYTFRLYEVLITKSKELDTPNKSVKISVDELRNILQFPESQSYGDLKKRVLEKAKIEFNAFDIENSVEQNEKKLFKSFDYLEQIKRERGRGRNPVSDIVFMFELLPETEILMLSKPDSIKKELDDEHWIMTELRILIDKNKARNPYFASMPIHFFHGLVIQSIENAKKNNGIYGNLDQITLLKSLERAFNSFKKSNGFESYLLTGISRGIQMNEKPE